MPEDEEEKLTELEFSSKHMAVIKKKGYTLERKLSEGAYGHVYKGVEMSSGTFVAIKVMVAKLLGKNYQEKFWPRELSAMVEIRHPNVIETRDIWRAEGMYFIVMEFANGGDMTQQLKKYEDGIDEKLACYWFTQATNAMVYIHDVVKMAHRDIKLDNIMLHNYVIKVCDFGFARYAVDSDGNPVMASTFCGTIPYYSPQILAKKKYNALAADAFAMGVVLFGLLNNKFPYHYDDRKKQLAEMSDPNFISTRYIKKFPDDLCDLLEKGLLEYDEAKRITMAATLKHPWIVRKGK